MIRNNIVTSKNRGFTLIESVVYIGLFGIMFTGIFVSIYPFFTGAERLTRNIATEGEVAFVLSKIRYTLNDAITSNSSEVSIPDPNFSDNKLALNGHKYEFTQNGTRLYLSQNGGIPFPLNAERVKIENFKVVHNNANAVTGEPRSVEITFDANGSSVGPIIYYLHF